MATDTSPCRDLDLGFVASNRATMCRASTVGVHRTVTVKVQGVRGPRCLPVSVASVTVNAAPRDRLTVSWVVAEIVALPSADAPRWDPQQRQHRSGGHDCPSGHLAHRTTSIHRRQRMLLAAPGRASTGR
jgi:hypothetical protein